ncbi:MAG: helix-turn-helix transcriptional regulator [Victivallaceae bacterium]
MLRLDSVQEQNLSDFNSGRINRCYAAQWVLDYSIGECGRCRSGGSPWLDRGPGIAHLYPPGTFYDEDHTNHAGFHSAYILFSGESPELTRMTATPYRFARIIDPAGVIRRMLGECAAVAAARGNAGYFAAYRVFCELQELLFALAEQTPRDGFIHRVPGDAAETPFRLRVEAELERRYAEKPTLAGLAAKLGVSVSALAHRYRLETGATVFETLTRIRLEQSLPLLLAGKPLKEIAAATGFADQFYYSKVFKRHYGRSPRRFFPSANAGPAL